MNSRSYYIWISVLVFVFILINIAIVSSILDANLSSFIYTLDDPYIHLAVAENIMNGNYGVNSEEFTAPSSSVIWPFLLVFVHLLTFKTIALEYTPLFINLLLTTGTIIFISLFARENFNRAHSVIMSILIFLFFIFATNLIGLIYLGMEHSAQIFTLTAIAYYLTKKDYGFLLFFLLFLAPLVRYENMAISLSVLLYIYLTNSSFKKSAVTALALIGVVLLSFSAFLYLNGAGILPASVLIKSGAYGDSMISIFFGKVFGNLAGSLTFTILYGIAIYSLFNKKISNHKPLIISLILSMTLHLFFGRSGWFCRYEMYIIAYSAMIIVYIYVDLITEHLRHAALLKALMFVFLVLFLNSAILYSLVFTSGASNNIYRQQNLMGEIAKAYNKNVAVNDLGLLTFKNPNYVLDLYGLSSKEAMHARLNQNTAKMQELIEKYDVGLVMIYNEWFKSLPEEWEKVAVLKEDRRIVTPIRREVTFYTTGVDNENAIKLLKLFKRIELTSSYQ